ncbi:MAG TPA: dihydroneopterin aldolase [Balneolaceae bacterium]|nr:dihydroneopterin aldolase [Balneolaceae bacterium]
MQKKLTEVEIKNMRLRAILGINDWEREKKQDIVISIRFIYDAAAAITDDQIEAAVNYKTITKQIMRFVEESDFLLIETLADKLFEMVSSVRGVVNTHITVEKPHALRFCDNLIVRRSDYDE